MKSKSINNFINNLINENSEKDFDLCYLKDGRYYNDLFGISFMIPEDWFIINIDDYEEAVENQILVGEYEYYRDEMEFLKEHPTLFVTKYDPSSDKYFGLVTPTLNFNIIDKEPDYKDMSLKEYADLLDSQDGFGYPMLKNFRIINKSEIFNINGFDCIQYDTEYLFEHREIEIGIMVELSILNIDYGDFILDFSMTDCKEQNNVETEVFNRIISSITLKK